MVNEAKGVISAHGLTRLFGDFVAVDHIDLSVCRGEVFGLLGANGAGKTTAIRMLCGTLAPSAGEINVGGVDVVRHAARARGELGYVSQRFALYGDLSVLENLRLQAGLYGVTGARKDVRLQWALQHLELEPVQKTRAGELPLGYQRRLALAAALLHEPQVLFLDEPTSGADPAARQHFWELIYDLAEAGIGILVTTHYMDEALFCDRLALMHAGRIIERGTPGELLQRPLTTPILELHSPACAECGHRLRQWPLVREIVPHAGLLRLRLNAGTDPTAAAQQLRDFLCRNGMPVTAITPVAPELEDVFVAVLEEVQQEGPA